MPLTLQQILYQDLLFFAENGKSEVKAHLNLELTEAPAHIIFSISTYHRWVLWALRTSQIITKPKPIIHIPMPGGQGPIFVPPHVVDGVLRVLESQVSDSVLILEKIISCLKEQRIMMPTISTFVSLTETLTSEVSHKWQEGYHISLQEFELQLRYDLAVWFMFANQYSQAKNHLERAAVLHNKVFATKPRRENKLIHHPPQKSVRI